MSQLEELKTSIKKAVPGLECVIGWQQGFDALHNTPLFMRSEADVDKLIHVLHRLVDGGHSVIVIEHDLDVIAEADWIVDLGPEGGSGGGEVVASAAPDAVMAKGTHTGVALAKHLGR